MVEVIYNAQKVPTIRFNECELSELERKEFRVDLNDPISGRKIDFTITPYSDRLREVMKSGENSYRYNIDGDVKILRDSVVLPVEVYQGFRIYLSGKGKKQ